MESEQNYLSTKPGKVGISELANKMWRAQVDCLNALQEMQDAMSEALRQATHAWHRVEQLKLKDTPEEPLKHP